MCTVRLTRCIWETHKQVLLQAVKTHMKSRIMWHFIRVYIEKKTKNNIIKIVTWNPYIYTMDHPKFILSNQKVESISIQRVNWCLSGWFISFQPETIGSLPALQELWLDCNDLSELPPVCSILYYFCWMSSINKALESWFFFNQIYFSTPWKHV